VPFFLVGGRAMAEGYGERLTPLPDEPMRHLVVARPGVGCPTPEMYRRLDQAPFHFREFPEAFQVHNDFLPVAPPECHRLIGQLHDLGAEAAGLTGSGSAVFAAFPSAQAAERAAAGLDNHPWPHVWQCRTLTRAESLRAEIF
jgi:4-diphosphocytidyl-2-C-methyl-D-erythritol kinase